MPISSKYPKDVRAKYALIRIRNLIKQFPDRVRSHPYVNTLLEMLEGNVADINKFLKLNTEEITILEQTCDDLEYIIEELQNRKDHNDDDESRPY